MKFRDLYRLTRCNLWRVKIGKTTYEYGIISKEVENRPYITDLFNCEVLEVAAVEEQIIYVKLRRRKNVSC